MTGEFDSICIEKGRGLIRDRPSIQMFAFRACEIVPNLSVSMVELLAAIWK
jgi:hypothetical protein